MPVCADHKLLSSHIRSLLLLLAQATVRPCSSSPYLQAPTRPQIKGVSTLKLRHMYSAYMYCVSAPVTGRSTQCQPGYLLPPEKGQSVQVRGSNWTLSNACGSETGDGGTSCHGLHWKEPPGRLVRRSLDEAVVLDRPVLLLLVGCSFPLNSASCVEKKEEGKNQLQEALRSKLRKSKGRRRVIEYIKYLEKASNRESAAHRPLRGPSRQQYSVRLLPRENSEARRCSSSQVALSNPSLCSFHVHACSFRLRLFPALA